MNKNKLGDLNEMHESKDLLEKYNEYVINQLSSLKPINIGCVVSKSYILDFLIFYFSIVKSWSFYPYLVHAFTFDKETHDEIKSYKLKNVEAHNFTQEAPLTWSSFAAKKIWLIENSGIERCIISDIDALFLSEIPELDLFLNNHDMVFIGAPHSEWIIQTSLWSYKRNRRTIKFARKWIKESQNRPHSDASGLPFALYKNKNSRMKIKALVMRKVRDKNHHKSPYDVQANIRPFELLHDELGYKESQMGGAKVIHFGGLRPVKKETLDERMNRMEQLFPESKPIFHLYRELASKAFKIMECPF